MAKIVTKSKAKTQKESSKAAEEKMKKTQDKQLRNENDDEADEREEKTQRDNKKGVSIVNKHRIKTFGAQNKEYEEESDDVIAESRPKTAADQRRILNRDDNPSHTELVMSAQRKMAAADKGEETEKLTDEEIDAYLQEEKDHLKHYGKVKLTPRSLNTVKPAIQKASAGSSTNEEDTVKVTMFETIDPAPQVGTCNVVRDHGYEKLVKGETYLLPKTVAMILAEGKKGAIHD
jgi:hypothetical protein